MKNSIAWIVRILISGLFLLSAFAKIFSKLWQVGIWQFEKQIVDLGLTDWCTAPYLARGIIGLEIAIALAILQPHFVKRIVIPCTILLLAVFCAHLLYQISVFGNSGNCGCFGQLIKMTPLEAIIKNVITIAMLVYLFFNVKEKEKGYNNLIYPFAMFLASELLMFAAFPFAPCDSSKIKSTTATTLTIDTTGVNNIDTPAILNTMSLDTPQLGTKKIDSLVAKKITPKDTIAKNNKLKPPATVIVENAPAQIASKFATFNNFNGKTINIDNGKKLVCMFAPGCEHCQATCKAICAKRGKGFPEVVILFMKEDVEQIPEFFKKAGCIFPYQVLDIPDFWTLMGNTNTPSVTAMWNGNVLKAWDGIKENEFKIDQLNGLWK
jgi:hypothetical protein